MLSVIQESPNTNLNASSGKKKTESNLLFKFKLVFLYQTVFWTFFVFFSREANKALCGFLHVCKNQCIDHEDGVGVATGNWGCGAYGGDPEIKSLLQWIAVSQVKS